MSRPSVRVLAVLVVASLGLAGRGRWGSDTSAAPPSDALRIVASEFAFQPSVIDVPVDTPVTITLVNAGRADHASATRRPGRR